MSTATLSPTVSAALAAPAVRTQVTGTLRIAALAAPLLLAGLIGWAAFTPIRSAVITTGAAVVQGQNRQIQHLDGGIVSALDVKDGDRVEAGQLLVALDPTLLGTTMGILTSRLAEALALEARLRAEETGATAIDRAALTEGLAAGQLLALPEGRAALDLALAGQARIMAARTELRASEAEQSRERVAQMTEQSRGIDGLIEAKTAQIGYIEEDIASLTTLVDQGLAARPRLLEAERQRAEFLGALAQSRSDRAGIVNAIRTSELDLARSTNTFREQVTTDLRQASSQIEELVQQLVTTRAQLSRVEMRAPVAGVVHQMKLTTIGGVITPGETVMEIVPVGDGVTFEMRLDPRSIDEVHPGQVARLKFPGFTAREAPEIQGTVAGVSPATIEDQRTGQSYYRLTLNVDPEALRQLPEAPMPGMPVDAYLETGARPALAWLLGPLRDHLSTAFKEN